MTDFYTNKDRHLKYFTPLSKKIFRNANYDFVKYRKVAYGISAIVLVLGITAIFNGFKEGVEFSGGRSYVVKFNKPQRAEEIRVALEKVFSESPTVKTYGRNNDQFDITTDFMIQNEGKAADTMVLTTLYNGLKTFLPPTVTRQQFASRTHPGFEASGSYNIR